MEIIRIKKKPKTWRDFCATSVMRDYVEKNLGKLDTATSFMYLFARFGTPDASNKNDYKILYAYDCLQCGDLIFSIHASYREHVHFNFWFAPKYIRNFLAKRKERHRRIIAQQVERGIPIAGIYPGFELSMSKKIQQKNQELFNECAKQFLSEQDYKRLSETPVAEWSEEDANLGYSLRESVYLRFINSMSNSDKKEFNGWIETIDDIPEVKAMLDKMILELRTACWIRDVPINILGYENKDNVILHEKSDENDD
jgi:hypothetical protein